MADINLICVECKNTFYFSERDQVFFAEKGFQQPKRCYGCRQKRKTNGSQPVTPLPAQPPRHGRYNDERDDD